MESPGGSGSDRAHGLQLEKKRLNRAPSPARPFLKDVHSRSPKSLVPKSPKLTKQQPPAVPLAHPSRSSRRTATAVKDKPSAAKPVPRSAAAKKSPKPKACPKPDPSSPVLLSVQKAKPPHGSPIRVPTGAGSSSDLSDCSALAASSDAESGTGSSDRDHQGADNPAPRAQARAPAAGVSGTTAALRDTEPPGARATMSQPRPDKPLPGPKEAPEEELLREIEDLRSENDYLKVPL